MTQRVNIAGAGAAKKSARAMSLPERHSTGTPRRSVRSAVKDRNLVTQRQRQLVEAAFSVFLKKGFHKASVRDIGRAAGLTQGTIYNYIRTKNDILYLACDEMFTAYQAAVHQAITGIADPFQRLRAAVRATTEVIQKHQEYVLLVYRSSHELDRKSLHAILARVGSHIDFFQQLIVEAAHVRAIAVPNHRLAANILTFLPTLLAFRRWDLKRLSLNAGTIADLLVDFMLRGVASDLSTPSQVPATRLTNKRNSAS
jgi:AcrR family transcriptional regulator